MRWRKNVCSKWSCFVTFSGKNMGWYNPCFHFCTDMFLRICLVFQLKFHYRKFRKIKKNSFISPDNSADFLFLSHPFVFSFSLCLTTSWASLNCSRQETQHLEIYPPYRFLFSVPRVEKKNYMCRADFYWPFCGSRSGVLSQLHKQFVILS